MTRGTQENSTYVLYDNLVSITQELLNGRDEEGKGGGVDGIFQKQLLWPGMVAHICNPYT
jgi:hypothetical protein